MIQYLFLLVFFQIAFFLLPVLSKQDNLNLITRVKLFQDEKSSRLEIKLKKPLDTVPALMAELNTVSFNLDAVVSDQKQNNEYNISSGGFINTVKLFPNVTGTGFEIKRKYYSPVDFIKQEDPPALIVKFPRNYFQKESYELKPGITKYLIRTVNQRGPIVANILEVDLFNKNISVKVGLPDNEKIKSKDTLTNIVKNERAFAGINANYFDVRIGNPLGTLITDSTWLTGPVYDRVAIGFSEDKMVFIDQVMLVGNITTFRGFRKKPFVMFEIDGLNTPVYLYKKNGLYTKNWDEEMDLSKEKVALVVKDNKIKKIVKENVQIPNDGYVLVVDKNYAANHIKKRDHLKIEWKSIPDWSGVKEAISGGPYLIMNGQVFVDGAEQKFKFAKKDTYAPRSAIGTGYNGRLYLVAIDGRKNNYSNGLTLNELAEFLKRLDLKEAINLDGGGSTTLVADGKIISLLSDRHERKISSALLVFYK